MLLHDLENGICLHNVEEDPATPVRSKFFAPCTTKGSEVLSICLFECSSTSRDHPALILTGDEKTDGNLQCYDVIIDNEGCKVVSHVQQGLN